MSRRERRELTQAEWFNIEAELLSIAEQFKPENIAHRLVETWEDTFNLDSEASQLHWQVSYLKQIILATVADADSATELLNRFLPIYAPKLKFSFEEVENKEEFLEVIEHFKSLSRVIGMYNVFVLQYYNGEITLETLEEKGRGEILIEFYQHLDCMILHFNNILALMNTESFTGIIRMMLAAVIKHYFEYIFILHYPNSEESTSKSLLSVIPNVTKEFKFNREGIPPQFILHQLPTHHKSL